MIFIAVALGLLYGFLIRKGNWQSLTRKHFRLLALLILVGHRRGRPGVVLA